MCSFFFSYNVLISTPVSFVIFMEHTVIVLVRAHTPIRAHAGSFPEDMHISAHCLTRILAVYTKFAHSYCINLI